MSSMKPMFAVLFLIYGLLSHSVLTEPVQVTAYEGDTVMLQSSGDSEGRLTRIQWFIFHNRTFIATWRKESGGVKTNLFWSYIDRLSLNTTNGNLQIKNVTRSDDRLYTVLLRDNNTDQYSHDVQLNVRAKFPDPILSVNMNVSHMGRCVVELYCTSPRDEFNISWTYTGSSPNVSYVSKRLNRASDVLWANLPADSPANFRCTISDDVRNSSRSIIAACKDESSETKPIVDKYVRKYYITVIGLSVYVGLIVGVLCSNKMLA